MLRLEGVTISYGPIAAVQQADLEVEEGEVVALLGPNGAGKTSLIAGIMGVVPISGGAIRFADRDISRLRPEQRVRLGLGVVPEGRRVFADLTVAENLKLGASTQADKQQLVEDLERYLQMFPILAERYEQRAGTLSGGEQQQLAIARSLMPRPRFLMLDEPSLGLAPVIVKTIFELIGQLRAQGLTLLLVEQNAHEALRLADRAYLLHSGRIRFSGKTEELRGTQELMDHYLGAGVANASRRAPA